MATQRVGLSFSRVNPADAIRCVWTSEIDSNKPRVDGDMFESGKKKLSG